MLPKIVFFLLFFNSNLFLQEKFFVTGSVKIGYDNKVQQQLQLFNSGYQVKTSKDGVYFFQINKDQAKYPFYIFIGKNIKPVSSQSVKAPKLSTVDKKIVIKVDQVNKTQTTNIIKSSQLDMEKEYDKIIFIEMNPDLVKKSFQPIISKQKNIFIMPAVEVLPTKPEHKMTRKRDKNILRSMEKNRIHQKQKISQRFNKKSRSKSKIIS